MESQPLVCMPPRKFQQVSVGKCHAQTATDRFGDGAKVAIRDRERASLGMHPQSAEMPFTWPGLDSDDEQEPGSIYRLIPSMQKFRNNLTALSQAYNLYFVAYQGRIFIYRPRSVPAQKIPRRPDLQLAPKPSAVAREIGGYLDIRRPHLVNNIVTGFLGKEEIVVACYDDGDVVAYYVREVAEQVSAGLNVHAAPAVRGPPKLFFHENVGISAWGLAVHQRSRLIAVSSNRHEVIVFAFGLAKEPVKSRRPFSHDRMALSDASVRRRDRNWRIVVLLGANADNVPNVCFVDDDEGYADKICAIDIKGAVWLADIWKACQGPIYIPPLCHPQLKSEEFYPAPSRGWGILAFPESSFIQVKTTEELFGLSPSRVEIIHESHSRCSQPLINIRKVLNEIPGNPCRLTASAEMILNQFAPWLPGDAVEIFDAGDLQNDIVDAGEVLIGGVDGESEGEVEELEEEEDVDEEDDNEEDDLDELENTGDTSDNDMEAPGHGGTVFIGNFPNLLHLAPMLEISGNTNEAPNGQQGPPTGGHTDLNAGGAGWKTAYDTGNASDGYDRTSSDEDWRSIPTRLDMTFFPHSGVTRETPRDKRRLLAFLERPIEYNPRPRQTEQVMTKYGHRLHLLRTYEKDVELRGFYQPDEKGIKEVGVLCPDVLNFGHFRDQGLRHHFHATSRLNMFAHAPELGLVVIGSPTGRVVLLTLTRMAVPVERPEGLWEHGFRVEWVLPSREDEEIHRKVLRPLHGMAIGPVQVEGQGGGKRNAALPRKYRLMLHYRNHDILSYEITREEQTGKLCIF